MYAYTLFTRMEAGLLRAHGRNSSMQLDSGCCCDSVTIKPMLCSTDQREMRDNPSFTVKTRRWLENQMLGKLVLKSKSTW